MLISLLSLDTTLATNLAKAQTLWHRKPGHIWEVLLGKSRAYESVGWVWAKWPHLPPSATSPNSIRAHPLWAFSAATGMEKTKESGGERIEVGQAIPGQSQNSSLFTGQSSHHSVIQTAYSNYLGCSTHHFLLPELGWEQGRAWSVLPLGMTALPQAAVFHKEENKGCFESLA